MNTISLEPAARQVCCETSRPPFLFELPPAEGRKILEKLQSDPVLRYSARVTDTRVNTGRWGVVPVHCICPEKLPDSPGVIFYIHGAGWVFGSLNTHRKLVYELAARTGSLVIFPEYSLSPEAKYPVALEQCYYILCFLPRLLSYLRLKADLSRLTVAGDSVGGGMAAIMTLLAKYRSGPRIRRQLLYYPVTNACFDTGSYRQFACGYYLYREGMMWFWDQYTTPDTDRSQVTLSPLRACEDQLKGLPEAMILNGEADVLRDEGEEYARRLRQAGVGVTALRFQGIIHDFVMLNALDDTFACRAAMDISTEWISSPEAG